MSTAVAALPPIVERHISPPHFPALSAASSAAAVAASQSYDREPAAKRPRSNVSPGSPSYAGSAVERASANAKSSNTTASAAPPLIKVKKEPTSPSMSSTRPRPKRLDLSSSNATSRGPTTGPQTSRPSAPLTSRDSAGLAIQDVGLACLSPGFQTNDPGMREQLQRSLDVRDQQRQIIEARKGTKPSGDDGPQRTQDTTLFGVQTRTPTTSKRKGPPPGLSIAAPSAAQFANDRVIQSAPLNQTFTGLRPGDQAYTRHAQHGPSALGQTSHIHHVPATQTNNRLPPIADVFANDRLDMQRGYGSNPSPPHNNNNSGSSNNGLPPAPSPSFPPPHHHSAAGPALSARSREFRSAEEAVAGLSGGRDDLMPKHVHYGGVQPPTPPSPNPPGGSHSHSLQAGPGAQQPGPHAGYPEHQLPSRPDVLARTSSLNGARRRGREEFEADYPMGESSPPPGPSPSSRGAFRAKRASFAVRGEEQGEGDVEDEYTARDWMRGMSGAEKKEEFLRLCSRAWDLFHS